MTHEGDAEFLKDIDAMFGRLKKAAGVSEGLMTQRDLDVLAAASADLLTLAIANMPEPRVVAKQFGVCPRHWGSMLPKGASGLSRRIQIEGSIHQRVSLSCLRLRPSERDGHH
jgi:hypothetical protein